MTAMCTPSRRRPHAKTLVPPFDRPFHRLARAHRKQAREPEPQLPLRGIAPPVACMVARRRRAARRHGGRHGGRAALRGPAEGRVTGRVFTGVGSHDGGSQGGAGVTPRVAGEAPGATVGHGELRWPPSGLRPRRARSDAAPLSSSALLLLPPPLRAARPDSRAVPWPHCSLLTVAAGPRRPRVRAVGAALARRA